MTEPMQHTAREYEAMALEELDLGQETMVMSGNWRENRAQVFATLALAAATLEKQLSEDTVPSPPKRVCVYFGDETCAEANRQANRWCGACIQAGS